MWVVWEGRWYNASGWVRLAEAVEWKGWSVEMNERIEINGQVHFGKPVIRGTRVPVTRVLGEVAAGTRWEEIAGQYGITVEDIRAAVEFASSLVAEHSFIGAKAS